VQSKIFFSTWAWSWSWFWKALWKWGLLSKVRF